MSLGRVSAGAAVLPCQPAPRGTLAQCIPQSSLCVACGVPGGSYETVSMNIRFSATPSNTQRVLGRERVFSTSWPVGRWED